MNQNSVPFVGGLDHRQPAASWRAPRARQSLGARLKITPRAIRIALGVLWILDAALQYQPSMFHEGFVNGIILPSAQKQPGAIASSITWMAHLITPQIALWNALFATAQLAIGIGFLFRRTLRPAILASVAWSLLVWWFGEGLGGLLTGHASPLTGAPGAVILYAGLAVLLWPRSSEEPSPPASSTDSSRRGPSIGVASSAGAAGRFGRLPLALALWAGLWSLSALLWLLPANRARGAFASQLSAGTAGEPSWYSHFLQSIAGHFYGTGAASAWLLALVSLGIGLGPLLTSRATSFLLAGAALELGFWVTGMGFGELTSGAGTDPESAPLFILLAIALLPKLASAGSGTGRRATGWRRPPVLGAGVALVGVLVLAATAPIPASDAVEPPARSTAQQEAGMKAGQPLSEPKNLNTRTPSTLNVRLVAEPKQFEIGGKKVWGESYDGDYVGPTMHFMPDETVNLTLVNKLSTWTNLHFHGMHMSPSGHADNPFIGVAPGKTFHYHFRIPKDQPVGTFWYHDHEMCMGTAEVPGPNAKISMKPTPHCQDIESQIYDGLSGTIIVGNDQTLLPADLRHVTTHTLVIKDMQIDASNHLVSNSPSYEILSSNPTVRLINGELRPVLTMRPGQTELWRIANEGADIFYHVDLPGYRFTVIGQDGYPVAKVTSVGSLYLPAAKRFDVLVTAPSHPGTSWFKTLHMGTGPQGDEYPLTDLMKVEIKGAPMKALPMPAGAMPTALPSLANEPIAKYRSLTLSENKEGTVMYIDHKQFNPNKSDFSSPAVLGTTEQWTIKNVAGEIHVFHLHTVHFQVMSVNDVPQPYTGEQDLIEVPPKEHGKPGSVVIRVHFSDFTGKLMFHCHIAAHEVQGMMSFVNVVKPSGG